MCNENLGGLDMTYYDIIKDFNSIVSEKIKYGWMPVPTNYLTSECDEFVDLVNTSTNEVGRVYFKSSHTHGISEDSIAINFASKLVDRKNIHNFLKKGSHIDTLDDIIVYKRYYVINRYYKPFYLDASDTELMKDICIKKSARAEYRSSVCNDQYKRFDSEYACSIALNWIHKNVPRTKTKKISDIFYVEKKITYGNQVRWYVHMSDGKVHSMQK